MERHSLLTAAQLPLGGSAGASVRGDGQCAACAGHQGAELAADLAALFEEGTDLRQAYKVEQVTIGGAESLAWIAEENGQAVRYDVEPMSGLWLRLWQTFSAR